MQPWFVVWIGQSTTASTSSQIGTCSCFSDFAGTYRKHSWRTRDIRGDQFRQAKSSSKPGAGPPRDPQGAERYAKHLPFQVFCCESGTHVVDPAQSYYRDIMYRFGTDFHNSTDPSEPAPEREPNAPCLDSAQAWFCRDLWVHKAALGVQAASDATTTVNHHKRSGTYMKRAEPINEAERRDKPEADAPGAEDDDADAGADYDAEGLDDAEQPEAPDSDPEPNYIPNANFDPVRIIVNPRCVTTYAGVSHTQLARDLFGSDLEADEGNGGGVAKYKLDQWLEGENLAYMSDPEYRP
jgi:hypothetical protein